MQWQHDVASTQAKTVNSHPLTEGTALPSVGVNDQHLRMACSMLLNEVGELCRVVSFIQHVAADDEIEFSQLRVVTSPMPALISHHRQSVQK